MEFNEQALIEACKAVANQTLWQTPKPQAISDIVDSKEIDELTNKLYQEAIFHLEFIVTEGRDPNLLTRAVNHLTVHAIPPMKDDINWFKDMLTALVDFACPNYDPIYADMPFLADVEKVIFEAKKKKT